MAPKKKTTRKKTKAPTTVKQLRELHPNINFDVGKNGLIIPSFGVPSSFTYKWVSSIRSMGGVRATAPRLHQELVKIGR